VLFRSRFSFAVAYGIAPLLHLVLAKGFASGAAADRVWHHPVS
jgi:hypothetical protein